jgi:hypothetical protein
MFLLYALQIAPSRVGEMYRLIDWAALHGHFRLGVNPWLSLDSPIQVSRYRSHEQRAPYTTSGETHAMVPMYWRCRHKDDQDTDFGR